MAKKAKLVLFQGDESERQPWDIQPGEPVKWFAIFEEYRLLGPERTLAKVAEKVKGKAPKHLSPWWRESCSRWNWVDRARAWDLHQIYQKRKEWEEAAAKDKETRLMVIQVARGKLVEALSLLDPGSARFPEVFAALKIVNDELRNEYDDQPAQRFRLSTNEADLAIANGLAQLAARRQDAASDEDQPGTGYPFIDAVATLRDEDVSG